MRNLNFKNLYNAINKLIINRKQRINLQKSSLKNFYLTDEYICKKIDNYREKISNLKLTLNEFFKLKKLKILHVTNFNERHNGRLF